MEYALWQELSALHQLELVIYQAIEVGGGIWRSLVWKICPGGKADQKSFSPFFSWAEQGPCGAAAPAVCSGHAWRPFALAGQQRETLVRCISSGDTGHSSCSALQGSWSRYFPLFALRSWCFLEKFLIVFLQFLMRSVVSLHTMWQCDTLHGSLQSSVKWLFHNLSFFFMKSLEATVQYFPSSLGFSSNSVFKNQDRKAVPNYPKYTNAIKPQSQNGGVCSLWSPAVPLPPAFCLAHRS